MAPSSFFLEDHHCSFINCCVPEDNHVLFLSFVTLASLNIGAIIVLAMQSRGGWTIPSTAIYNAMIFPFVSGQAIFQVYLISVGMTTNEFVLRNRYDHLKGGANPFYRGFVENWRLFWMAGRRSGKMRPRRRRIDGSVLTKV